MKWLKGIFISLGILGMICLGGYIVYNVAYAIGETTGYDRGYSVGEGVGYNSGEQAGYDIGKADGYTLGEQEGYDEGYSSGKTDGYDEGYGSGITDGYEEGVDASLGHGYTLRDPTYKEAITFLRQDKTDKNEYVKDTYGVYVCSHFARDAGNNAEEAGLRCAFIELRYSDGGHALIAFDTTDKGLTYFDPVTDERAEPVVGKRYYQCIIPKAGYYYKEPSFDDTIMDILVIW